MLTPRISALLLAGAVTLSLVTAAPAAPGSVDLLSAGPSAVRLGVTAPEPELLTPDSVRAGSALLHLEGWDLDLSPGIPALPSRVVRVAVPPAGPVTVRGFGLTSVTREGVTLAPTRGGGDAAALTANGGHMAPERARLLGVTWMRNQRVALVEILPCDYEPAARRLTAWSRIELEVDFTPSAATTPAEASDPFESIYASSVVNYEQGKSWRRAAGTSFGGRATATAAARSSSPMVAATSRFVGHTWVKIAIPKSGFYKITYGQLRALAPFAGADTIGYQRLRLYAWPGRPVLSEVTVCDTCDYRQVAISIEDSNGDGLLGSNDDGFSFYAQGPSDWADHYDPAFRDTVYIQNPYTTTNYCFLSFDGAPGDAPFSDAPVRIAANSYDVTPHPDGTETVPPFFRERLHFEQDSGNEYFPSVWVGSSPRPDGSEPWAWPKFMWRTVSMGGTFQVQLRTPFAAPGTIDTIWTRVWGTARNTDINAPPCSPDPQPDHLVDVAVSNSAGYDSVRVGFPDFRPPTPRLTPLADSLTTLRFRVVIPPGQSCPARIDQSTLDYVNVFYSRLFVPENDELVFDSPGRGNVIYRIGPFASGEIPRMYDITDPFAPLEMKTSDAAAFADSNLLKIEVNETGPRRYAFLPNSHFRKPPTSDLATASGGSRDDLRGSGNAADHVIIYYDAFQLAADSLAAWRRVHLPMAVHAAPYHVAEVPVSAIFDQFSGGRIDPVALRLFLRAAFRNWGNGGLDHAPPTYVTFFGDASFDFRNLLALAEPGEPGSLVPSFEDNNVAGDQYSSDDWLLNQDDDVQIHSAIPDFIGGRIPAGDPTSAMEYLTKKLFPQERSAPTGTWRNRVMLVADDDQAGDKDDVSFHWTHVAQTAALDSSYVPKFVDRYYVYLHTYPDGPGRTKPAAKADIKNTINTDGIVMFNYIGHGSPFKLSDESVLIDVDAGTFVNASRLPLFVAASCDVGKFNDPRVQSLGERLLFGANGGTLAVISASEIAFSGANVDLNYALYSNLFNRSPVTNQFWEPIGKALLDAKLSTGTNDFNIQNNQKYHLMGDAAARLPLPQLWVDVEIDDEAGGTPVTELHGGQTLTCKGRVLDSPGGSPVPYSGVVDVLIEDSAPRPLTPPCAKAPPSACTLVNYDWRAGAIFRGSMVVTNGTFSGQFVVPIEAQGGPHGRVRAYVEGFPNQPPQTDGVGSQRLQISPGNAPLGDESGPSVALSFPGGVTSVKPDAVLRIELSDPSGILTTGHTVQNGIIVTVDGNTTARVDVTSSFRYAANSHTTGTATFTLPNLQPGPHTIAVSAADNFAGGLTAFQHRSSASISFQVADAPPISIRNAYLFPNPTESGRRQSGGTFVVDGPGDSANVMVRLFTISGRLIRELKSFGTFGQVQVPWDGLDAEGYPLANGTYLFKVYVNGRDESGKSTARQKAARDGRFVILNH